ncbi:unnamed protein product [Cuscuta campestris]|uniref:Alpha 1,4-glycosyltransferase domain-containing protein n=1 Tax=Cuscuta campestris TaxID=132261 RepID=A0A484MSX4_9ASTE|nr:unnamed protein product [Cuscuta campestris]
MIVLFHLHSYRFCSRTKLQVFSAASLAAIVILIFFSDTSPPPSFPGRHRNNNPTPLKRDSIESQSARLVPPPNATARQRMLWFKNTFPQIFKSNENSRRDQFDQRVRKFYSERECKVRFFTTWIASPDSFGAREFLSMESIFKAHRQHACLIILSQSLDSELGRGILSPMIESGFGVIAMTPDLPSLLEKTPAERWYEDLRNGEKDPGEIPFAQNLSNLIRLAFLYRYGGVFLDTDFVVTRSFSGLKNCIGAQSVDRRGKWTRLNNAVLVFEPGHALVHEFMREFALTFDGNKWGHNGPYLVSRVVDRVSKNDSFSLTVLPPMAFYPVDWIHIGGFFEKPRDDRHGRWMEAKMVQLREDGTYGIHLWNMQSRRKRIEKGSIIGTIFSQHCIICKGIYDS